MSARKLIGFMGYAGSGKDEAAKAPVLGKWRKYALAKPIYVCLYVLNPYVQALNSRLRPYVNEFGWDVAKRCLEVRELLQHQCDGFEQMFGDDILFRTAYKNILGSQGCLERVAFTDVRTISSVNDIRSHGGFVIRVTKKGITPVNDHKTEVDLIKPDFYAPNDGTVEDLHQLIKDIVVVHWGDE